MNKSTPLAELPNLKKGDNSNAYEEKENQIVSEILSEIDNSNKENMNIDNSQQENAMMIEEQKMLEEQKHMMNQEQEQMMHQESNNRRLEDSLR